MMHFEQGQIEVLKLSIHKVATVGLSVAEIAQVPGFPMAPLLLAINPIP